jgi:hypothetical protein
MRVGGKDQRTAENLPTKFVAVGILIGDIEDSKVKKLRRALALSATMCPALLTGEIGRFLGTSTFVGGCGCFEAFGIGAGFSASFSGFLMLPPVSDMEAS